MKTFLPILLLTFFGLSSWATQCGKEPSPKIISLSDFAGLERLGSFLATGDIVLGYTKGAWNSEYGHGMTLRVIKGDTAKNILLHNLVRLPFGKAENFTSRILAINSEQSRVAVLVTDFAQKMHLGILLLDLADLKVKKVYQLNVDIHFDSIADEALPQNVFLSSDFQYVSFYQPSRGRILSAELSRLAATDLSDVRFNESLWTESAEFFGSMIFASGDQMLMVGNDHSSRRSIKRGIFTSVDLMGLSGKRIGHYNLFDSYSENPGATANGFAAEVRSLANNGSFLFSVRAGPLEPWPSALYLASIRQGSSLLNLERLNFLSSVEQAALSSDGQFVYVASKNSEGLMQVKVLSSQGSVILSHQLAEGESLVRFEVFREGEFFALVENDKNQISAYKIKHDITEKVPAVVAQPEAMAKMKFLETTDYLAGYFVFETGYMKPATGQESKDALFQFSVTQPILVKRSRSKYGPVTLQKNDRLQLKKPYQGEYLLVGESLDGEKLLLARLAKEDSYSVLDKANVADDESYLVLDKSSLAKTFLRKVNGQTHL